MLHASPDLLSAIVPVMGAVLILASANQEPELVIGLVNRSVRLSAHLHLPLHVQETVWKFTTGSGKVKVAEAGYNFFSPYSAQFKDRVAASNNGTTIIIQHLSLRDAGKYCAEIILISKEIYRVSFILIVYEPVPSPTIWIWKEDTTYRCNVTLHCSVPSNASDFTYTWKYRHRDAEYQQCNSNRSKFQISLPPDHQDTEFLCIVQNLVDQKNVSVHIGRLCVVTNATQQRGCNIHLRSGVMAAYLLMSLFFIYLSHCCR